MEKGGYVYILTNKNHAVLYVGVNSTLFHRITEHKNKIHTKVFTARYNVNKLVYFEAFLDIETAIAREKQLKAGARKKKIELIESINPEWVELNAPD